MRTKRTLFTALLILLVMGTAVAYAAWTDTLDVQGTVTSAKFDVRFLNYQKGANCPVDTVVSIVEQAGTGNTDDQLNITLPNAVPGVTYEIKFTTVNNSDVPVRLSSYDISDCEGFSVELKKNGAAVDYATINAGANDGDYFILIELDDDVTEGTDGLDAETGKFTITLEYVQAS